MTPRSRSSRTHRAVRSNRTRWWVYVAAVVLLLGVAVLAYAALTMN